MISLFSLFLENNGHFLSSYIFLYQYFFNYMTIEKENNKSGYINLYISTLTLNFYNERIPVASSEIDIVGLPLTFTEKCLLGGFTTILLSIIGIAVYDLSRS